MRRPALFTLPLAATLASCLAAGPDDRDLGPDDDSEVGGKADDLDEVVDAAFGLDARPVNDTCIAPPAPPSNTAITTDRVFPNLTFQQPVGMHQAPEDDSQWYVVEKPGRIRAFDDVANPGSSRTFVDIRGIVDDGPNEAGLLGMAFHPDWQANGEVYLSFNLRQSGQLWSVVTRIRSTDGGQTLDTSTHELVFSQAQPAGNHNGGQIAFGPDGFLYYGLGDGGGQNDPNGNGQNTSTYLGAMMRLDIDNPSGGRPYGIPSDNPFADGVGGQPEIYAWGLRNPWRFSFDGPTGDLWLADVGQDTFEEIDLIERGGNYGWNAKEGFACFAVANCNQLGLVDPIHVYDHSEGDRSITGGFVYRGTEIPDLEGSYVYGDVTTGRIWALHPRADGEFDNELMLESGIAMATFAQGHDGEIYVPNFSSGAIHQIVSAGPPPSSDFPQFLSDTGCFDPDDPRVPVTGMIPYDVASPLWSDGAEKQRFMALPPGGRIEMLGDGDFIFPVGTVLAKTFILGGRRVETRLMMRHPDGAWGGYAYQWNDAQTDAQLLESSATVNVLGQQWRIPSRGECSSCHTDAANHALGPEFLQLNMPGVYPSTNRRANQMDTLAHVDLFSNLPEGSFDSSAMPHLSGVHDEDVSLEDRAKSYLHSNCSSCHRPGGPGRSDADMRYLVPFSNQGMCNVPPETGGFGLFDPRLVRAGDPDNSILVHRMESLDAARMPALGTSIVDEDGVDLIRAWIESLEDCN